MERASSSESPTQLPHKTRKRRIPKACGSCRRSKVRCDGQRPCSRCNNLKKVCVFTEPPKDEQEKKIESLESQIESLKAQLEAASPATQQQPQPRGASLGTHDLHPTPPGLTGTIDHNVVMQDAPTVPTTCFTPTSHLLTSTSSPHTGVALHPPPHHHHQHQHQHHHPHHHAAVQNLDATSTSPSTTTFRSGSTAAVTGRSTNRRSHFTVEPLLPDQDDVLALGLVTPDEAESYFAAFFQGCHQYVPVFDPRHDSLHSIRARSGLLFSTICAVGCRVLRGTESHPWRLLNFHIKRVLNAAIGGALAPGRTTTLETVQALLVRACFVSERSLLVTVATRMAIDLRLYAAYDELSTRFITRASLGGNSGGLSNQSTASGSVEAGQEDDDSLMRKTRTWIHLLVLGHILHADAGDLLTFRFSGSVRRCRILLDSPGCTDMDLHLFSQLELNVLRANTYAALASHQQQQMSVTAADDNNNSSINYGDEIMDVVRDAKIDVDVWFNDWLHIFERRANPLQRPWLALHLRVQQCWADTMALCRAVRMSGVENVDAMTPAQRSMLLMAKEALKRHLDIILEEPRTYLRNLRFAMDFVWAKCAFCFLLLLKLSMLVAEDDEQASRELVSCGKTLLSELYMTGNGAGGSSGRSSTSRVYLQLLQTGIEKFSRTVLGENLTPVSHGSGTVTPRHREGSRREGSAGNSSNTRNNNNSGNGTGNTTNDATAAASGEGEDHNELESFVPEQFVFEWDFPGLTLFSNPTSEAGWLDEFLRGALVGGEDFYGFGWNPVDPS